MVGRRYCRPVSVEGIRSVVAIAFWLWAAILLAPDLAAAEPDQIASMYRPDGVVEIDLGMPQASIDALEADPGEYQPGTIALRAGAEAYGPYGVGLRLKGSVGSFRPLSQKSGFKVKFDEYVDGQTFFGLEKMTLNNMVQDPSMVHETLAYELFRALGVPAPRTGYAFVRLNGEPYGVYLNLETLDLVSLPRWFPTTLHLYEGQVGLDVSPGAAPAFEVDEGKSKKREDLEALILAADSQDGDWSDAMTAVADLEEVTRMWAVERYIGHWDGYAGIYADLYRPNNYYLHSSESGLFRMLPWGTDQTWRDRLEFGEPAGGRLFNRCLGDSDCLALYEDGLRATQAVIAELDLGHSLTCIAGRLAPWQAREDGQRRESDPEEIEEGVAGTREFLAERPAELAGWLGSEGPEAVANPIPCVGAEAAPAAAGAGATAASLTPVEPSLRLARTRVARGALIAQLDLSAPGRVDLLATVATRAGRLPACVATSTAAATGSLSLRCPLTAAVRRRLGARWLRIRLEARLTAAAGSSAAVAGVHLAARTGGTS